MPSLVPFKIYRGEPSQVLLESTAALNAIPAVYTVPVGKRLIIKHIRITNLFQDETGEVNIKSGTTITASDGDFILRKTFVDAGDVMIFDLNEILDADEKIFLWQGVSACSVQISGVEVTL